MSSMMERSRQGEPIEEDALPALSQQGCLRAESIPEAAQEALTLHQQRLNRQKRARYERELTLTHLAAMLGSLSELNTVAAGESLNDLQAAHVIRQAMDHYAECFLGGPSAKVGLYPTEPDQPTAPEGKGK